MLGVVVELVMVIGGPPEPVGVVAGTPAPPAPRVVGGPEPPNDFVPAAAAAAAAFSSDMRMVVCLVEVTTLVAVSRVVMVVTCDTISGVETPGRGTAGFAAGVDVVVVDVGI